MRFFVGTKSALYGTEKPEYTAVTQTFSKESPLVSIGAVAGLAGLKSVELKAMDLNCVEITKKAEAEQKEYETAMQEKEDSGEIDNSANLTKTLIALFFTLLVITGISGYLCKRI